MPHDLPAFMAEQESKGAAARRNCEPLPSFPEALFAAGYRKESRRIADELTRAALNVEWKLNRCEVRNGTTGPATIDRNDVVIRELRAALDLLLFRTAPTEAPATLPNGDPGQATDPDRYEPAA